MRCRRSCTWTWTSACTIVDGLDENRQSWSSTAPGPSLLRRRPGSQALFPRQPVRPRHAGEGGGGPAPQTVWRWQKKTLSAVSEGRDHLRWSTGLLGGAFNASLAHLSPILHRGMIFPSTRNFRASRNSDWGILAGRKRGNGMVVQTLSFPRLLYYQWTRGDPFDGKGGQGRWACVHFLIPKREDAAGEP